MTQPTDDHRDVTLKIAVVSDLHAFDSKENDLTTSPSHLKITLPENDPGKHPISGLIQLIEDEKISADLLLCGGDMGDKAQRAGIMYSWKAIHQLGEKLNARLVTATSGNHDLDSRYITTEDADAKGILLGLEPPYPLSDEALNNKYWARNYVIVDKEQYRLVLLNSSAYHGTEPDEINHGRVSEATLSFIKKELTALGPKLINILLCHHHPQQHMDLRLGDYDVMKNGELLLNMLGSGDFGRWLIIHGHKHHPKVTYAKGSSTSPVIFSAGSLCANLYLQLQTKARNQFYLITLPFNDQDYGLVGIIQAWDWAYGDGWAPAASSNSGLPAISAFGYRGDPRILAKKINELLTTRDVAKLEWDTVSASLPEVTYLLPQDLHTLDQELKSRYGLTFLEEGGRPREVGKAL
jgi:3',5'-cyclic AMP phosphodiesterase CpdA